MGSWAYCQSCEPEETGLGPPDLREALQGYIVCPKCGAHYPLNESHKNELLIEMAEDVAALKRSIKVLTKSVKVLANTVLVVTPKKPSSSQH